MGTDGTHYPRPRVILFLHHRYRTLGGEERSIELLSALVADRLGEEVLLQERDSAQVSRSTAALGLLRGGLDPDEVFDAVRAKFGDAALLPGWEAPPTPPSR